MHCDEKEDSARKNRRLWYSLCILVLNIVDYSLINLTLFNLIETRQEVWQEGHF